MLIFYIISGCPLKEAVGGRKGRARAQDGRVRERGEGDPGGESEVAAEAAARNGEEGGAVQTSKRIRIKVKDIHKTYLNDISLSDFRSALRWRRNAPTTR